MALTIYRHATVILAMLQAQVNFRMVKGQHRCRADVIMERAEVSIAGRPLTLEKLALRQLTSENVVGRTHLWYIGNLNTGIGLQLVRTPCVLVPSHRADCIFSIYRNANRLRRLEVLLTTKRRPQSNLHREQNYQRRQPQRHY